jgi:fumarate reductase flavoprotein subunit
MSFEDIRDLEADVIVIGGGGAGMAAATAAAEKGARVVLLEKRGLGGNSALAFGIFAAESPVQEGAGVVCRRNDCFKIAMEWAHWRINPAVVRAFIDRSGDTVRWLEEKGVEIDASIFRPNQFATVHRIKGRGYALIRCLAESCRQMGVELLIHTPAKKILMGETSRVTGVVAEKGGKPFTISTSTAVIATGGFAGNKTLLKQYCPDYHDGMEIIGIPHTGDGLLMALEIGAATEGMGNLLLGMPRALHPPYDESEDLAVPPALRQMGLISFAADPRTLRINKRGKRFLDESIGLGENAIVRQPDNTCFTIFDSAFVWTYAEQGGFGPMGTSDVGPKITLSEWEQYLQAKVKKGLVKIFSSLNEMADWMGIIPSLLQATIDEYNTACDRGYDPLFAKDPKYLLPVRNPPYYVIKWAASCLNTMGGIKINENTEVLDKEDNPIPGLYAAGVDTAGSWESPTYCMKIAGHAFGFSVISGRIAGENAARYASKTKK